MGQSCFGCVRSYSPSELAVLVAFSIPPRRGWQRRLGESSRHDLDESIMLTSIRTLPSPADVTPIINCSDRILKHGPLDEGTDGPHGTVLIYFHEISVVFVTGSTDSRGEDWIPTKSKRTSKSIQITEQVATSLLAVYPPVVPRRSKKAVQSPPKLSTGNPDGALILPGNTSSDKAEKWLTKEKNAYMSGAGASDTTRLTGLNRRLHCSAFAGDILMVNLASRLGIPISVHMDTCVQATELVCANADVNCAEVQG